MLVSQKVRALETVEFIKQDSNGLGRGAQVYRLACDHGVSSAALLPGKRPLSDVVVLDLLLPGHHRANGCRCEPSPNDRLNGAVRADVRRTSPN